MENVLEVYKRQYDARRPVICLDETSRQLIAETHSSLPAKPDHVKKTDYEYRRNTPSIGTSLLKTPESN